MTISKSEFDKIQAFNKGFVETVERKITEMRKEIIDSPLVPLRSVNKNVVEVRAELLERFLREM